MIECFKQIPIKIYPLSSPIEEILTKYPTHRSFRVLDLSHLNPELLDYFKERDIKIREDFIFWNWHVPGAFIPHTDGDYRPTDGVARRRLCGINWNFTPGTRVDFYSTDGTTPEFVYRSELDYFTLWKNATKIIDVWDDAGPVLFNPQVPHNVNGTVKNRRSITLRFYETYEDLREKLNV
jgi:hypothetical protein